jgi:2-keto-3-deoxy-6-phosphogluconate aldolase
VKDDGKFKLVVVAEGWPTVQIGPTGGITVTELKSYAKAFDAAMDGLALYTKQKARETRKATATAPAPKAAEQTATA